MRLKGGGRGHRRSTPPSRQRRRSRPRPSSFLHSPRFRCPVMALFVVWSEQSEHSSHFASRATVSTFSVHRRGEGAKEPAGSRCPVRRLLLCRLPPEPRAGASALSAGAASVGQVAAPLTFAAHSFALRARTAPACASAGGPPPWRRRPLRRIHSRKPSTPSLRKSPSPPPFLLQWEKKAKANFSFSSSSLPKRVDCLCIDAPPRIDCCITTKRDGCPV